MEGNCKLCGVNNKLQISHIIPAFIYSWLKNTSGTGFLRFGQIPNKRIQDGLKEYLLCSSCEQLFQKWETKFASNIFHPIVNDGKNRFYYESWLLKFAVSLSWRVLIYLKQRNNLSNFSQNLQMEAGLALQRWRDFLLNKEVNPGKYQLHMLPLSAIKEHSLGSLPSNINRYFLRVVEIDAATTKREGFIYIKLPRILVAGFIHIEKPRQWVNTIIHVKNGTLGAGRYELPNYLAKYLRDRAINAQIITKKISQKQNNKIAKSYKKNLVRFSNSDTLRALQHDVELFGENGVFERKE